jgi:ABC-type branched-subunit amino acid transport system ATPase component
MGMGRTFQTPKPFGNYSVYNNIFCIALTRHGFKDAAEKTMDILKMTKLEPFKDFCSLKLPIEKRKWLDLARVLALDPKFIMMDEVMAGLNPFEMEESLALVRDINKEGMSVLFIEHVMKAVVNICTRVIVLNEGRYLCEGEPKEVLERNEVIQAYLGGQKC